MLLSRTLNTTIAVSAVALSCMSFAAYAQETGEAPPVEASANDEIVVTATRIRGSVITEIPPVQQIDEKDIAAYGASSATDLIAALAPQTGSGRGRGGGQPVVLLNGQRISGFRELRDLPPEAIKRVQIFPEEVALQYGFRPDQRVINFILKDNFSSFSTEIEGGVPQDGGYSGREVETTLTRIGESTRISIDTEYETRSRLTENERNIIASPASAPFTLPGGISDIGAYRSLLPETERFEVNSTFSKVLAPQTTLSLNGNYKLEGSRALLGLPSASFLVPASSPFSQDSTDVTLNRYFTTPGPLERKGTTGTAQFGLSFNTVLSGWRMALTGDYASVDTNIQTTRNADFTALRTGVLAGTIDPYAPGFGSDLRFISPDISDSLSHTFNIRNTFTGSPLGLPAGELQVTVRTAFARQTLDSLSIRSGVSASAALSRNDINGALTVDAPLIERGIGALGFLGDISVNGNYGKSNLSDFGTLTEYGAGLVWSPFKELTFQASLIGDENAPDITQLGNPVQATPNVAYFDFVTGQSVFIDQIGGGNAALIGEKRRDLKLSLNWSPKKIEGLNLQVEYFKNNSRNTTAAFPILTPEIEAAFADRVVRDASGRLISIDQRPVNFDRERSQRFRWGFNMSGNIGKQPEGGGMFGGPGGGSRGSGLGGDRQRSDTPRGPEGRGGGFGGGRLAAFAGGRQPSRWQLALYHTYRIQDDILIRPGVPVLDLLNGSAVSNLGGSPRNEFELSGGVFSNGIGMRLNGTYRGPTRADGNGLPGSSDLRFSDLAALNAVFFVNLDNRGSLTKNVPFLKGTRISFRVENVFNDIIDVRDQNGLVPLSYQSGYLDPKGRYFELSLRKRF